MSLLLPDALGWKYPDASGIETRGGKLRAWPESLGAAPTEAQQQAIIAEYETHLAQQADEPDDMSVLMAILEDKNLVTKKDRDDKREQLKRGGGAATR